MLEIKAERFFFNHENAKAYIPLAVRMMTSTHIMLSLFSTVLSGGSKIWKMQTKSFYYYEDIFDPANPGKDLRDTQIS